MRNAGNIQNANLKDYSDKKLQYMDGWIKNGRDKIFSRGPQIGPNIHYTDEK
jgi:hypothetical protein